jgi:hypothetical protein
MTQQPFPLGRTLATPGALNHLQKLGILPPMLFARHLAGDWADMDEEDQRSNHEAVKNGGRIFSSYKLPDGSKIWVITEAISLYTTCLIL